MTARDDKIDRRALLKLLGTAGASASVLSGAGGSSLGTATVSAAGGRPFGGSATVSAAGAAQSGIEPFEIRVSDAELDDLHRRLTNVRWPPDPPGEAWALGTDRAYLEGLIAYWRDDYDWRVHEAALNSFDHYTTTIEGQSIHFVHQRGSGGARLPLLMSHGWPGTIWEMLPSVRRLSDPAAHGGAASDAFDVVVPSIPGFGFSGEPAEGTDIARTAELWVALMEKLGYQRFGAYGSDWGAGITRTLGARFADRVVGVHTPGAPRRAQREPQTDAEREYLASTELWAVEETGVPAHPGHEATDAGLRADRFAGRRRRLDHREASLLERLRRRRGNAVQQGPDLDAGVDLLAHADHRHQRTLLPREWAGELAAPTRSGTGHRAARLRGFPGDLLSLPAAPIVHRGAARGRALDAVRDRRPFPGHRGARVAGRRPPYVLPVAPVRVG